MSLHLKFRIGAEWPISFYFFVALHKKIWFVPITKKKKWNAGCALLHLVAFCNMKTNMLPGLLLPTVLCPVEMMWHQLSHWESDDGWQLRDTLRPNERWWRFVYLPYFPTSSYGLQWTYGEEGQSSSFNVVARWYVPACNSTYFVRPARLHCVGVQSEKHRIDLLHLHLHWSFNCFYKLSFRRFVHYYETSVNGKKKISLWDLELGTEQAGLQHAKESYCDLTK